MIKRVPTGRPIVAALVFSAALLAAGAVRAADRLEVVDADGAVLAGMDVPRGGGWCLHWNHSVTGDAVADCYVNDGGRMVLSHAYQPDFAAGLGHFPGRGTLTGAADGGYWIIDIDEPVAGDAYLLRVGQPAVRHRLVSGSAELDLSALAPGHRVTIRLRRGGEN